MRNICLTLPFLLCLSSLNAQEQTSPTGQFGISLIPAGDAEFMRFEDIDGAGATSGKDYFTIGINYYKPLGAGNPEFLTGVEYSRHKILKEPSSSSPIRQEPEEDTYSLLTIPAGIKWSLGRYFYLQGGALLDMDLFFNPRVDSQTGFGLEAGTGIQYPFNNGWTVSAGLYFRMHALFPFAANDFHEHLMDVGLRTAVILPF